MMYLKHMTRKSNRLMKKQKEYAHKEKQKYDLYGEYNDHEPCFPISDNRHVEIESLCIGHSFIEIWKSNQVKKEPRN